MDPSALLESHGGVCDGAAVEAVPSPRRWRTRRTLLGALAAVAVAGVATGAVLGAAHLHTSESAVYNPDGSRVPTRAEYEASLVKGDGLSDIPIDEIVNIGKKVLEIVKEGTPVVNVQSDLATAIPAQATGWLDMSDWKGIKSWGPFVWSRRNGFGTETIHYEFTFDWNYGGRYNGKGSFLQEGTVGNKDIHAAWAHDMDVGLTVGAPSNVGSSAWPVAQVSFTVRMKVDTMINHEQRECKATLMGDGSGKLLYCDDYKLV
eukprot:TRINITY_DN2501_c0_g1_i5.p1 TRINITY_DN2501_c0_g1~~TRINITY_DN2501_c0_g1_i5.p1  ORF type:complete len:291 (-),score=181.25 TRINITY_DN2501_c0_g1_i5:57-839(-)